MTAETERVVIDGREIAVAPGTTILEAARRLGIEIPTLCHVEGPEPSASCFLCCVQVEGRRALSPSCAMPVADGMVVETAGDDVRASRKMALELLLSDHAGDCVAPCAVRCPAGLDVPGFVREIAAGIPGDAMDVLFETLSLPGTLGRVCPRLCEESCRRCDHDEPLAIAALHRWAADENGRARASREPSAAPASGKSVGIVGAGPAGLTAAFYLLRQGHAAVLYDAQPLPGGMLRYGIPAYRLPRAALDAEIAVIRRLGAGFRMGRRWGRDFTLADLRREHDAVFVAIGAQRSRAMGCAGDELALAGLDFLERVAKGDPPPLGASVIVIGGGNTAMDAARTALRLGVSEVRLLYRRTRHEMPCLMEEVEEAEAEGVELECLIAPEYLARHDGGGERKLRLVCHRMELGEVDASGRRRPQPIPGARQEFSCDTVIAATGQAVEVELAEREGLDVHTWGIRADARTLATSLPGVFAGGDGVLGADFAVRAVAAGRLAAAAIGQYLRGEPVVGLPAEANVAMHPIDDEERAALFRAIERRPRAAAEMLDPAQRRDSFAEVDGGLTPVQALDESRRCLSCGCRQAEAGCSLRDLATQLGADPTRFLGARRRFERDTSHPYIVYEPGKCILCDACVRIAAEAGEEIGLAIVGRGFDVAVGVPFDRPLAEGLRKVAQRCAAACPTGALALRTARACDLESCGVSRGAGSLVRLRALTPG